MPAWRRVRLMAAVAALDESRVWGLGVSGSGFTVEGSGFRVSGLRV